MVNEPVWNVFMYDFNGKAIKTFNVFHSHNFFEGCRKAMREYRKTEDIEKLNKDIKNWAKYSFWSKCEYELVMSGLFGDTNRKVDVFEQLSLNWNTFFRYVVEHKSYFLRAK